MKDAAKGEAQERLWSRLFNLDERALYKKRRRLSFTPQTDGVAASLNFARKERAGEKTRPSRRAEGQDSYAYVDQPSDSDVEIMKGRGVVGRDPGRLSMARTSDGTPKLRRDALQRRAESTARRSQRTLLREREKSDARQVEAALSERNSSSVDAERLKDYLLQKNKINAKLRPLRRLDLRRKLKWRQLAYGQRVKTSL